ncbi:hypothetical protein A3K82_02435 [Candidatus Pacearchaeota archaeon RBG_19FT_COMBO_34_9]|nr:MAG: hypothetical protein A3K82_02435 [Candidatus Pacearchaeota archaeon RBG_19FT_COMBO_34_9]OGJ16483.1 MAG: hypothetical protein A3K74_00015 [Candidatus Pacearchaeota archaeon RBG_13_33_26]
MVKHLEDLGDTAHDVIKSLRVGRDRALTINDLGDALKKETGEKIARKEIYDVLSNLMKYGNVRRVIIKGAKGEERKYYLSRGLGSGARNYAKLTGKANPFTDLAKYIGRVFGSIFILFGIGFLAYQNLALSGAVISNGEMIKNISPILSVVLIAVGGLIFLTSFKKY